MNSPRELYMEAHLPPSRRTMALVRWIPGKKRSLTGWILLVGFVVLNETRGVYVAAEFLKALQS